MLLGIVCLVSSVSLKGPSMPTRVPPTSCTRARARPLLLLLQEHPLAQEGGRGRERATSGKVWPRLAVVTRELSMRECGVAPAERRPRSVDYSDGLEADRHGRSWERGE